MIVWLIVAAINVLGVDVQLLPDSVDYAFTSKKACEAVIVDETNKRCIPLRVTGDKIGQALRS